MTIEAVIGANYGDEGKGLFTEHLCRNRPSPLVVLSNGGCQRGHTVNNVELGIRHVFHHFGSGTLLGVPSIFSKTFLLNPIKYVEEKRELKKIGIKPMVFRTPSCLLQLPSDMFTNQMLEKARGQSKHGSCGWGIWETIVRNDMHKRLTFEDFASLDYEMKKSVLLEEIEWQACKRLEDYRSSIDYSTMECIMSEQFIKHFIQDFEEMERDVKVLDNDNLLEADLDACECDVETLIVENGQGLLLDKKYAPIDEHGRTDIHTTPSKCGLEGVVEAIGDDGCIRDISANYISRTYFTRHGAGPFPEEDNNISFKDETNIPNGYQGSLKFGKIDDAAAAKLLDRIASNSTFNGKPARECNFVLTHCNEVDPHKMLKDFAKFFSYEDDSCTIEKSLKNNWQS